ncbi:MAG: GNAT family N-acetyltransferase [Pseudomonadota bacterium]
MTAPVIRRAVCEDAAALALVGAATFLETYAHMIGLPDMLLHFEGKNSADAWRAFTSDPAGAAWIAELPETRAPIGFALLTPPDLPIETGPADIELRRIYVMGKWHGHKLGRQLVDAAIAHARERGMQRLLIGVYSGNDAAIGFYRRLGCELAGSRRFRVGDAVFDDLIFGLDL